MKEKRLLAGITALVLCIMIPFSALGEATPRNTEENGRITEITRYTPSGGEWKPYEQYVFEYNDTEISPSRYATMINYFIADHGGNYYYYNWY